MTGQRQRIDATDDWQQLDLLVRFPEQRTYELIRPVVLFGHSPAERARLTGAPQRTLYRQAARFEREGMASLFGPPKVERHRTLPEEIQQAILILKAEHPGFHFHEIATICGVQFGRRPSHHTVRRILAEDPLPVLVGRRFPPYHQIADPAARRHAVLTLHGEGWSVTSIAAYLQVTRHTVHDTLKRWIAGGLAGMEDKSHARTDGVRTVGLPAIAAIKRLQENPELGAWRMHAALKQQGIELSPPGALWADAGGSWRATGSCTGSPNRRVPRTRRHRSPSRRPVGISIGASTSGISTWRISV
jgi:putative transposase